MALIARYLSPNFYVTNNDVEVIDTLVDNGVMFRDFSVSQVVAFLRKDDFCLVFFFADDYDRGFSMYVVSDFSVHLEEMHQLAGSLRELLHQGYNYKLFSAALGKVTDMALMAPTFRALWKKTLEE